MGLLHRIANALRRHPKRVLAGAMAIAAAVVLLLAAHIGFDSVADRLTGLRPDWLLVAFGLQLAALAGYALAYRSLVAVEGGPRLGAPLLARLVLAGFGAFAPGGGLALDYQALRSLADDEREAAARVVGLGALEYVVIAPAACVAAIVLLLQGSAVIGGVLWPWALAVPPGFALGFWLAAPARRDRVEGDGTSKVRRAAANALTGINLVRQLPGQPGAGAAAIGGMALYWAGEAASLWASIEAVGASLGVGALILGLATGYAMTRRSMPLAGAGTTEALLTVALVWVGLGAATALAATIVYRIFSFVLPILPAFWGRTGVDHLLSAEARAEAATRA